ncbi:CAP domain-containing protein, partial [Mycena rebaudengoi]
FQEYVDIHNWERSNHGASNLVWNDTLAGTAQYWADQCLNVHSNSRLGPFGENLAAGTGGAFTIAEALGMWNDEASDYVTNPTSSHWTQVVWKETRELGCAVATCPVGSIFEPEYGPTQYYVCEYSPPGNVDGEFEFVSPHIHKNNNVESHFTARMLSRNGISLSQRPLIYVS